MVLFLSFEKSISEKKKKVSTLKETLMRIVFATFTGLGNKNILISINFHVRKPRSQIKKKLEGFSITLLLEIILFLGQFFQIGA